MLNVSIQQARRFLDSDSNQPQTWAGETTGYVNTVKPEQNG